MTEDARGLFKKRVNMEKCRLQARSGGIISNILKKAKHQFIQTVTREQAYL